MTGIEGSGIVNPRETGADIAVDETAIVPPQALAAASAAQQRDAREKQQGRDRRPAPAPTPAPVPADPHHDVSPYIQVLVALDEAVVLQAESEAKPEPASATAEYAQPITERLAGTAAHALSFEA